MMKRFEIKLTGDSQFSHGVVKAGSLVGVLVMREPIEPTSILSMIQFSQAMIEEKEESTDESSSDESEQVENVIDTTLDEVTEDEQEPEVVSVSDLTEFLDESLVEALAVNGIKSKSELLEFIASGKDLIDLEKIGLTRAKKILVAVSAIQETQK